MDLSLHTCQGCPAAISNRVENGNWIVLVPLTRWRENRKIISVSSRPVSWCPMSQGAPVSPTILHHLLCSPSNSGREGYYSTSSIMLTLQQWPRRVLFYIIYYAHPPTVAEKGTILHHLLCSPSNSGREGYYSTSSIMLTLQQWPRRVLLCIIYYAHPPTVAEKGTILHHLLCWPSNSGWEGYYSTSSIMLTLQQWLRRVLFYIIYYAHPPTVAEKGTILHHLLCSPSNSGWEGYYSTSSIMLTLQQWLRRVLFYIIYNAHPPTVAEKGTFCIMYYAHPPMVKVKVKDWECSYRERIIFKTKLSSFPPHYTCSTNHARPIYTIHDNCISSLHNPR